MVLVHCINRNCSPCKGCARDHKRPGCHDHCGDFQDWRAETDAITAKRREHLSKPFRKIL